MYCKNCGTQLDDHAKFCYACGTPVGATPAPKPHSETPPVPKKKKGLIALVAIVALVAVAAVVLSGLFVNDSVKVAAAFAKSGKAFSTTVDRMALTDFSTLEKNETISEEISMWIDEIYGDDSLSGLGYRLNLDSDLPNRNVDLSLTPFWGSADLLSIQMRLDDSEIFLGSPELTGDDFYMINTQTFCQDLEALGVDMGDAADFSFNIFDIAQQFKDLRTENEAWNKAIKEAAAALLKEVQVEKSGSETVDINGAAFKCTAYDVLIPETAMHTFLNSMADAYPEVDYTTTYMEMLRSIGIPAYIMEEMETAMADPAANVQEVFNFLHEALETLGDIHLNLCLNDGYVVSAVYQNNFDGVDVAVTLTIGGGDNYVDNICLAIAVDEEAYRITSTGNHAGTSNAFTDVTVVEYVCDGQVTPLIQMDTTYAPKQVEDNFSFVAKAGGSSLELQGQLTCDKDFMNLYLSRIQVSELGDPLFSLGMEVSIGKYEGKGFSIQNSQAFADMTMEDLTAIAMELTNNATEWVVGLDTDIQKMIMEYAYNFF